MKSDKPIVLAFLSGMPDIESLYPTLASLAARNNVEVRCLIYSKLYKKEPRLQEAFRRFNFIPVPCNKLKMKLFFVKEIINADAILGLSDPFFDKARRWRSFVIRFTQTKTIFLQHGVVQTWVNFCTEEYNCLNYYSSKILTWEPQYQSPCLSLDSKEKLETIGFIKQNILSAPLINENLKLWLDAFPKRLLICHSFRWSGARYDEGGIGDFYQMLELFLQRNPNVGVILRSHRAKNKSFHTEVDERLLNTYKNLLVSDEKKGLLKASTIHDVISMCQYMISSQSTAVLDGIYSGCKVSILPEESNYFPELQVISSVDDIERFIATVDVLDITMQKVRDRFGRLTSNVEKSAIAVESSLL